MHTHFGSATHAIGTFLSVLVIGAFWRVAWLHVLAYGVSRNSRAARGFASAALAQY